jgi:hypothetical protein
MCARSSQLPAQGCGKQCARQLRAPSVGISGDQWGSVGISGDQWGSVGMQANSLVQRQAGSSMQCWWAGGVALQRTAYHACGQLDACSRPRYQQLLLQEPAGCQLLRAAHACPLKAAALLPSRCASTVA